MKKALAVTLALGMTAGMLSGSVVTVSADAANDSIVVAAPDEPDNLSTTGHDTLQTIYLNLMTYNGLFRLDENMTPVPDLVESYEVEKDDKGEDSIWKFELHQGVKFHDGEEMTAEDVVASLDAAKAGPNNVSAYTLSYQTVEATGDYEVTITTDGPNAALLYDLANHGNAIVPKKLLDEGYNFAEAPIGTGPYKFIEWKHGDSITFEAFDDYFDADRAAKIKNVTWRFISEGASRTMALESGDVDYVIELDSASMSSLVDNDAFTIYEEPTVQHQFLNLNNEKGALADVNVRKAINSAINKDACVQIAMNGHALRADSQTPSLMDGETTEGADTEYSVEKAKEYLEAWGGDPATIELDIIVTNDAKKRCAEVIQANLKDIGINATISEMDLATYLTYTAEGNHTAFIGGYTASSMMTYLKACFHSTGIGSANKARINDPELDAMIEKACATIDDAERTKALQEVTVYLNELCPQVPLYQNNVLHAAKADLQGVSINGATYFYASDWSWS